MEQKNTFLKIMSIIILIVGICYLILAIAAIGGAAITKIVPELSSVAGLFLGAGVLMLIGGIFEIVAGRTGLKACKDPSKAKTCVVLGIILMVPSILAFIFSIVALNFMAGLAGVSGVSVNYGNSIGSLVMGIAIPVLYILAAKKSQATA